MDSADPPNGQASSKESSSNVETSPKEAPAPAPPTAAEKLAQIRNICNSYEKALMDGIILTESIKTTFSDVHVPASTVEALENLTLPILHPEHFTYGVLAKTGVTGVLLYGVPGTGKTLLAEAFAKHCQRTILEVRHSDVYQKYIGEDEKSVQAIFTLARKLHPCVVFIDEADGIFRSRTDADDRNPWYRHVTNQFLREWDGMLSNDGKRPLVMAATSRPFDLDDAVLRRMPLRIFADVPDEAGRQAILRIHLKDEQLDADVDIPEIAASTPSFTGSDLRNLVVQAALTCVRETIAQSRNGQKDGSDRLEHSDGSPPARRILRMIHFDRARQLTNMSVDNDMKYKVNAFHAKFGKGRKANILYQETTAGASSS